ncbi:hypothetical protein K2173_003342 [Erythroxylum novogranatense]|uniref:Uncharacterized protein n=1 Tax=Erythroxylum novogranatense TaxID=1862640 RepID=A0AAV8S8B4_9ROSI|nr:hypothetical protein K2173_003342 [Erythroxylum novogranatense]
MVGSDTDHCSVSSDQASFPPITASKRLNLKTITHAHGVHVKIGAMMKGLTNWKKKVSSLRPFRFLFLIM